MKNSISAFVGLALTLAIFNPSAARADDAEKDAIIRQAIAEKKQEIAKLEQQLSDSKLHRAETDVAGGLLIAGGALGLWKAPGFYKNSIDNGFRVIGPAETAVLVEGSVMAIGSGAVLTAMSSGPVKQAQKDLDAAKAELSSYEHALDPAGPAPASAAAQ